MLDTTLQALCERGQRELMETRYLAAAATLAAAELRAWEARDFDTLSRLYLPLQEARRQIRQRCGEGTVQMHLLATSAAEAINPTDIAVRFPHGQLLVAGWGSVLPALELRWLAQDRGLYLETFLAAVYPTDDFGPMVAIVPLPDAVMPTPVPRSMNDLASALPPHSLLLRSGELPPDAATGSAITLERVMDLWERLHAPFLSAAKAEPDPIRQMQAYRVTLRVDPACELAHQFLADIARQLSRG
jgi:hypothetical protein